MTSKSPEQTRDNAPFSHNWTDMGTLVVRGKTAKAFLQGYVTSNAESISDDAWQPTALCNVKGRVLANGWLHLLPPTEDGLEQVGLIIHRSLCTLIADFLKPYAQFSRCQIVTEPLDVYVQLAADIPTETNTTHQPNPNWPHKDWAFIEKLAQRSIANEQMPGLTKADVGAQMNKFLIDANYPIISSATSELCLPQALGLEQLGAVDFDKGCYLGQEIIARAQHRGRVKRKITKFDWTGAPPVLGQPWQDILTVIAIWQDPKQIGGPGFGLGIIRT